MDPNFEAIMNQLAQLTTQMNQAITQINTKLDQAKDQLTQLTQSQNQMNHRSNQVDQRFDQATTRINQLTTSFDQVGDRLGTLDKTHRAEPITYEPSSNPLSLSQPEPYRIDIPRFEPITFEPITFKPITYEPIALSLPIPVILDLSQFFISQTPLTTPLVHQDDLEEEIYEANPSLVEEHEDNESIEDLEEYPIEDPGLVDYDQTQIETNLDIVDPEVQWNQPSSTMESNLGTFLKAMSEQLTQMNLKLDQSITQNQALFDQMITQSQSQFIQSTTQTSQMTQTNNQATNRLDQLTNRLDQVEANPVLVDLVETQVEATLELANFNHTQPVVEESLKEEEHEESNPTIRVLPEEPLEESPIRELSPLIYEPEEFIKDLIFLDQCPQDEVTSLTPHDLFPKINDPFFYYVNPLDRHQTHKVNLISLGLIPETPSSILLFLINPESSPCLSSCQTNSEPTSYFLPFPETLIMIFTIRLHFIGVCMLHSFIEHVMFTFYFWKILWHLLGVHSKFSCACHARVKCRSL